MTNFSQLTEGIAIRTMYGMAKKLGKLRVKRFEMRLSPEDRRLMDKLNAKLGLEMADVMRLALRRLAETESVVLHKTAP